MLLVLTLVTPAEVTPGKVIWTGIVLVVGSVGCTVILEPVVVKAPGAGSKLDTFAAALSRTVTRPVVYFVALVVMMRTVEV